jgi:hybrid polyketide synthase/nonribosomal peptide synthetase FtdB
MYRPDAQGGRATFFPSCERKFAPVAVIGMGCRFPGGANSPYQFWENLVQGKDGITETPPSRWSTDAHYSAVREKKGRLVSKWGGYIDGITEFDPTFFGISPREAETMDPQQRKLLEVAWEALEDAGQKPSALEGHPVGVFIGGFTVDYKILQFTSPDFENLGSHTATGVMMTMLSNRLSYTFDFTGPSMSVDTACSSSLVSVDLACKSLQNKECSMALAGGVLLKLAPQYTITESKGYFLSPNGRSHNLDDSADGYVRAEGVGVVVLKLLESALSDGDPIHAVIAGCSVNQDGRTKGITVPNGDSQYRLMKQTCAVAGVDPTRIQYLELHGTGTPVGDPIEANAVCRFLREGRTADTCYIGSVKTNIGHAESAAGMAGLIKTIMALQHKKIPPHLHLKSMHPAVDVGTDLIKVPTRLKDWPEHEGPAVAAVNSFGFGGTNAHLILCEHQGAGARHLTKIAKADVPRIRILPFSARDKGVLNDVAANLAQILSAERGARAEDVAYSAARWREFHNCRGAVVFKDQEELVSRLNAFAKAAAQPLVAEGQVLAEIDRRLVWVFTGIGPQWWAMGRQLYHAEPVFRRVIDELDTVFGKWVDWSLRDEMLADEQHSNMSDTWLSQTANFALQVGLAAVLRTHGIAPDAIVGHSTGEIAAFYEAGVYSVEDAALIAVHRSALQQTLAGTGKIAAVGLPEEDALPLLEPYAGKLSVAAVNSPNSVSVSGETEALEALGQDCAARDIFFKMLRVDIPFHSPLMDPIKDALVERLTSIRPQQAKVPLYSTVTGGRVTGAELNNVYWRHNVREPVYFAKAAMNLMQEGYGVFLEVGPHPVLAGSIKECAAGLEKNVHVLPSIRRKEDEREGVFLSLARLYTLGFAVDWTAMYPNGDFVSLPNYPWKKDHYFTEPEFFRAIRQGDNDGPLLGRMLDAVHPIWENRLGLERIDFLEDHNIQGSVVFPAAGYVEMVCQAVRTLYGGRGVSIDRMTIDRALFLSREQDQNIQLRMMPDSGTWKIISLEEGGSIKQHSSGQFRAMQTTRLAPIMDLDAFKNKLKQIRPGSRVYEELAGHGYNYGPTFRVIKQVWCGEGEVLARLKLPEKGGRAADFHIHPSLLDACFQAVLVDDLKILQNDAVRLPTRIESLRLNANDHSELYCLVRQVMHDEEKTVADIALLSPAGEVFGEAKGFTAVDVNQVAMDIQVSTMDTWLYEVAWDKKPLTTAEDKASNGTWLILADQGGLGGRLAQYIRENGGTAWLLEPGDYYLVDRPNFTVKMVPDAAGDVERVITDLLRDEGVDCRAIVHMWGLDAPSFETARIADLHRVKRHCAYSLINVARTLATHQLKTKLWVITRNTQPVDDLSPNPVAAPLWGIGRVLAQQELVERWGGQIDLDAEATADEAKLIFGEVTTAGGEDEVGYRKGQRYVSRLQAAAGLGPMLSTRLRGDGAYLVTGAFGALGRLVCDFLVQHGASHLILAGRDRLPPREKWCLLDANAPGTERIAFVRALEAKGCGVQVAKMDVCDEKQVRDFLSAYRRALYPPIRGLFFCAGLVEDKLLANLDTAIFDRVHDTKVMGAAILHKLLADEPLDYFVMFSSVAAQVTTAGQINYAAGNLFLDALAHHRRGLGLPALSINWGPWTVGMIQKLNLMEYYKKQRGMTSIMPGIGSRIMDRILDQEIGQVIVCEADWPVVLRWYGDKVPSLFGHLAASEECASSTEDADFCTAYATTPAEERPALVHDALKGLLAKLLGADKDGLKEDHSLTSLGMDSLIATELRNGLTHMFGQSVPLVMLLSGLTISELADKMNTLIAENIAHLPATEAEDVAPVSADKESTIAGVAHPAEQRVVLDEFPLSFGQKAIWFIKQMNPDNPAYNIGGAMHIPSRLNVDALTMAINEIVRRHAGLRTNFFFRDGEPMQCIYDHCDETLDVHDAQGQSWDEIKARIIRDNQKPFDLEKDALYRVRLYRQAENSWFFAVSIFHIISDAWSNYMFIDEMQALYDRYANGKDHVLPTIDRTYRDFVEWEQRMVNSTRGSRMYKYWMNHLPQEIPFLDLPADKPRRAVQTNNGASHAFVLEAEWVEGLKALSRSSDATVYVLLLSVYYTLLHKYSGQEDIIVGSPVAGRSQPEFASIYGYFVNPLPLWASFKGDPSFKELVDQVRERVLMGLDNGDFPFALLVDRLDLPRDPSHSAVFQVLFVLLNHRVEQAGMDADNVAHYKGFPMRFLQIPEEEGQFDLTLSMYEENGVYHGILKYNTDLFDHRTICRMAGHYRTLVQEILQDPDRPISSYKMLTPAERGLVIGDWKGRSPQPLAQTTIAQMIAQHAGRHPSVPAVSVPHEGEGQTEKLTFGELDRDANRLANYILEHGVGPNTLVGVFLPKCLDTIRALVGILKAGAGFLPLDPEYPRDRIAYMLETAKAPLVLTHAGLIDGLPCNEAATVVALDAKADEIGRRQDYAPDISPADDDTAYVIFTSGSTGKPKGVRVTQRNLLSAYLAWEGTYHLTQIQGAHLQVAGFSFDVFCGDFVRALCSGKKLVLCNKNLLLNIPKLYRVMQAEGVRIGEFVPSVVRSLIGYLRQNDLGLDFMDMMVVGSDAWTAAEFNQLKRLGGAHTRMVSTYGTTECTIDSTYFEGDLDDYGDGAKVPIGIPLPNSQVFILDRALNPVPIGVPGELCLAGDGVAAGYLGDPERTEQKFIHHCLEGSTLRIYRTGDLVRWDAKGRIQILQRMDDQVKIRGHRVEIHEIESCLNEHPNVSKAVVAARRKPSGENFLVAWYVVRDGKTIAPETLVDFITLKLPTYMVPGQFIQMDRFPLTLNNKVDIKGLPEPHPQPEGRVVAPTTIYEQALVDICRKMLGIRRLSITHNFFELGGDSLNLIELMIRIQEHFKIEMTVNALLRAANLKEMARTIEDTVTGKESGAMPYIVYNPKQERTVHCFPPAGGYSMVYETLTTHLKDTTFISYNYLLDQEKIQCYADLIKAVQPQGPYVLFGYSLGGNLAFETGRELEVRGETVSGIIIMDAYRITNGFKPAEADLLRFEEELKRHFNAHTGSERVQAHTLKQARDYIKWCYEQGNHGQVNAPVHFIIEANADDIHRKVRAASWRGSSKNGDHIYYGKSRHEEMLTGEYAPEHAKIIADIL